MASFDHRVRSLTSDEREWGRPPQPCRCDYGKLQSRCSHTALYMCMYDYVAGRRGNVSTNRRKFCLQHAARFMRQHRISNAMQAGEDAGIQVLVLDGSPESTQAMVEMISKAVGER